MPPKKGQKPEPAWSAHDLERVRKLKGISGLAEATAANLVSLAELAHDLIAPADAIELTGLAAQLRDVPVIREARGVSLALSVPRSKIKP